MMWLTLSHIMVITHCIYLQYFAPHFRSWRSWFYLPAYSEAAVPVFNTFMEQLLAAPFDLATTTPGESVHFSPFLLFLLVLAYNEGIV